MKMYAYCVLCIVLFGLLCSGCEKKTARRETKTGDFILGFSQIGAESAWRNRNTRSIQDASESAGIQLLYFNAEQKQENQIKALRSFIAYQVDVIAFVPIVSSGWKHVLEEARDANIPVLVCDREIAIDDETLYAGYIGTDSEQEGKSAAEFVLEKFAHTIKKEARRGPPVRIVELSGTEGSSVAVKRAAGFREVLSASRLQFEIVYSASGDFLRSKGYELACSVLDSYGGIDVLYSHNDSMTLGAIDAMKERNIRPGADIVIVTIDAEQSAIDALGRGEINCVVECNPKQGNEIIRLASQLARGGTIPRVTYMPEDVFVENDNLSGLPPRGY